MTRTRGTFRPRARSWPFIGKLAFAVVVILIAAVISGAIVHTLRGEASSNHATVTRPAVATGTSARSGAPTTGKVRKAFPIIDPYSSLVPLPISSPSHAETYNRAADFGGFTDIDGCKDTRAEVLIRTSAAPVTFTSSSNCTVKSGRWTDPWSGVTSTVAHDFQIDHTVPLANAWTSGAWSWTHAQRVAYANDLADADHLVAILTHENESKIDHGPDRWKPPSRTAWCTYARVWDHIKAKWHLSATRAEWDALVAMVGSC